VVEGGPVAVVWHSSGGGVRGNGLAMCTKARNRRTGPALAPSSLWEERRRRCAHHAMSPGPAWKGRGRGRGRGRGSLDGCTSCSGSPGGDGLWVEQQEEGRSTQRVPRCWCNGRPESGSAGRRCAPGPRGGLECVKVCGGGGYSDSWWQVGRAASNCPDRRLL
jgi:hypothetical protein